MKRERSHKTLPYLFLQYSCDHSVPFLTISVASHIHNRQLTPRFPCLSFYSIRCMFTIPCYLRLPVLTHSLRTASQYLKRSPFSFSFFSLLLSPCKCNNFRLSSTVCINPYSLYTFLCIRSCNNFSWFQESAEQ